MRSVKTRQRTTGSLKELLKKVIKNLGGKDKLTQEDVVAIWQEAVGDAAASHARPASFRKMSLIVNVDDSGWLYELTTRKKEILAKLEGRFGNRKIVDIRFRIGEIKGEVR